MQECVFCRIFAGSIPAKVIARNDGALAILDAFPLAPGHTLVISRSHRGKVQQLEKDEAANVFGLVRVVVAAVENATGAPATTVAIHNGKEAGQEIAHVHVHIIPRSSGDGAGPVHSMFRQRPDSGTLDMDSICAKIASQLPSN
jgi:histidine triad (HIT) family protein